MYKILLACAGGFSTSILVEKMKEYATSENIDCAIEAIAEGRIGEFVDSYDIVLLGPQASHMENDFKKKYDGKIIVTSIDMMDYGMMNGENVMKTATELVDKEKK